MEGSDMSSILVFYGSYRSDRIGIRFARFLVDGFTARGEAAELIDAKDVGLPIIDRMYKEFPAGEAPAAMQALAHKIKAADAFVFVTGEYNWGVQPGLKNLTDHFLEEWYWRPAAIASYSPGRLGGARVNSEWHAILAEMGMVVVSSTLTVGMLADAIDVDGKPIGPAGAVQQKAFARFADDLAWWTEAAKIQHAKVKPPY
jgi:NAD(P)H-dependent FMN reductase